MSETAMAGQVRFCLECRDNWPEDIIHPQGEVMTTLKLLRMGFGLLIVLQWPVDGAGAGEKPPAPVPMPPSAPATVPSPGFGLPPATVPSPRLDLPPPAPVPGTTVQAQPAPVVPPGAFPPPTGAPAATTVVERSPPPRFRFNIDAHTPLKELLPLPPRTAAKAGFRALDLSDVPEIDFQEPLARDLPSLKAIERTAHTIAKIEHLNVKKADAFMEALIERPDLAGLPFVMGQTCRQKPERGRWFGAAAQVVHEALRNAKRGAEPLVEPGVFWKKLREMDAELMEVELKLGQPARTDIQLALVSALMQILAPESESLRRGLAGYLASVPHVEATHALARLAVFSPEESVRQAAIDGLKVRRERDYTAILLSGLRYPLPAVARRAADALVKLERTDVVPELVNLLEEPDPRLPV